MRIKDHGTVCVCVYYIQNTCFFNSKKDRFQLLASSVMLPCQCKLIQQFSNDYFINN